MISSSTSMSGQRSPSSPTSLSLACYSLINCLQLQLNGIPKFQVKSSFLSNFKMTDAIWKALNMMLQIIVSVIEKVICELTRLLGKFKEKVQDIVVERAAEVSVDTGTSYWGLRSDMQLLARNLRALSSRASDIKEQVEGGELSGQKRKSEVNNWLEEVQKLENDFFALQRRVQQEKFWKLFLVGRDVRKMQDQVVQLTEQSRNFDGLLLENQRNLENHS